MVRWFLYSWISCWLLGAMAESTTPISVLSDRLAAMLSKGAGNLKSKIPAFDDKGTYQGGESKATALQNKPAWYSHNVLQDKLYSTSRRFLRSPSWRTVAPDTAQRGYDDTLSSVDYGNEPVNLEVLSQVESGRNPKAVSPTGALGLFQVIPWTQTSLPTGFLAGGATNLTDASGKLYFDPKHGPKYTKADKEIHKKRWLSMSEQEQRTHVNNYMTGALNHYEKETGSSSAARGLAIGSYNAGYGNIEKVRANPKDILKGNEKSGGYAGKMYQLRGYLGKFLAEGELTATEIVDAFPELGNNFNVITKRALAHHRKQKGRMRF